MLLRLLLESKLEMINQALCNSGELRNMYTPCLVILKKFSSESASLEIDTMTVQLYSPVIVRQQNIKEPLLVSIFCVMLRRIFTNRSTLNMVTIPVTVVCGMIAAVTLYQRLDGNIGMGTIINLVMHHL